VFLFIDIFSVYNNTTDDINNGYGDAADGAAFSVAVQVLLISNLTLLLVQYSYLLHVFNLMYMAKYVKLNMLVHL
jgi:hypothetical protein